MKPEGAVSLPTSKLSPHLLRSTVVTVLSSSSTNRRAAEEMSTTRVLATVTVDMKPVQKEQIHSCSEPSTEGYCCAEDVYTLKVLAEGCVLPMKFMHTIYTIRL